MFDFKDINVNYLRFIVYTSYFTVLTSAIWAGLAFISEGLGASVYVALTSGVVFYFYGQYFERKMERHGK